MGVWQRHTRIVICLTLGLLLVITIIMLRNVPCFQLVKNVTVVVENNNITQSRMGSIGRTLLMYSYFPGKTGNGQFNFEFFRDYGMRPAIEHGVPIDFLIINNGDRDLFHQIRLPHGTNETRVVVVHRRNFGFDFCAYNESFAALYHNASSASSASLFNSVIQRELRHVTDYHYFILMNASVRGPFLPVGLQSWEWVRYFTHQITDRNKLIGTTLNCYMRTGPPQGRWYPNIHLQSMMLVFDHSVVWLVRRHLPCSSHMKTVIHTGEMAVTAAFLEHGYNIVSQLYLYRGVDWTNTTEANQACERKSPAYWRFMPQIYSGINPSVFELIFHKANRASVYTTELDRYTRWTMGIFDNRTLIGAI